VLDEQVRALAGDAVRQLYGAPLKPSKGEAHATLEEAHTLSAATIDRCGEIIRGLW
jgi:hypothetical protein